MNTRTTLFWGALFAGLGVALGAFGAHALKPLLLANNKLETYEVAVRYQVYHALALLLIGVLMKSFHNLRPLELAAWFWTIGIVLFSGSLYVLCFSSVTGVVYLTPLGGFFFIAGWIMLLWSLAKK